MISLSASQEKPRFGIGFDYNPISTEFRSFYSYSEYGERDQGLLVANGIGSFSPHFSLLLSNTFFLQVSYSQISFTRELSGNDVGNNKEGLSVSNLGIEGKLLLKIPEEKKVSPFLLFGLNKMFYSVVDVKSENTDEDEYEAVEDLNSPLSIIFGLGTEYFFSESFSTFMTYRISINTASHSEKGVELSNSTTTTRSGFGLNFYF